MNQRNNHRQVSKFLSLVLRHQPEMIGMQLDENGWLDVQELILRARPAGHDLSRELICQVVAESDKQRFSLSEDGLRIRANQGHSVANVSLEFERKTPPEFLYHGTVEKFLGSIREQGLQKRARHHVHLSPDEETAKQVGMRRGEPIILGVKARHMHEDGETFFLSTNGVWLVDAVPVQYILFPS